MATLGGVFNWIRNSDGRYASSFFDRKNQTPQARMEMLDVYYSSNDLYEEEAANAYLMDDWLEAIKPLRNPVHRSVEFYTAKLCQGSPKIQILNKNEQTLKAVQTILSNSNFAGQKSGMLRKNALYGNTFFKANFNGEKLYVSKLDAKTVTDFVEDERGFLIWIRIDVKLDDGSWYTEYWTTDGEGYVAIYNHRMNTSTPIDQLGDPVETHFLSEFGTNYIPIIHVKFTDVSEKWGASCVDHALTKIDEANREITNLVDLMFQNKAYWAVTSGVDKDGLAVPTPDWDTLSDEDAKKLGLSKTVLLKFPGANATLSVPNYAWSEFLAIVKDSVEDIEKDLPELRYYTLKESELSGVAIRTLLAGAIDRAKEAQENFVEGLIKIIKICLSMGRFYGLFPSAIGSFDSGDFDMSIEFAEIVPSSSQSDKISALAQLANVDMPLNVKMMLAGFSAEEVNMLPQTPAV